VAKGVSAGRGACFRIVLLDSEPGALACWKDTVAVGLDSGSIFILSAITGSQVAILSGHAHYVASLVFSPDGALLVSGSWDNTVKLWDMQTGGVIKTFQGHTDWVESVSISADCTTIASGAFDKSVRLWDIQTGECHHIIKQEDSIDYVCFSPLDTRHLISISGGKVWQWDIHGQQIAPVYNGSHLAFSSDGTRFVMCNGSVVEVKSFHSHVIVAKFHMVNKNARCCCFSPDDRVIAVATGSTVYIWDITSSDPHLLEILTGHTKDITSLKFTSPSSLTTLSHDKLVKFWEVGAASADPLLTDPKSTPLALLGALATGDISTHNHSNNILTMPLEESSDHTNSSLSYPHYTSSPKPKLPHQDDSLISSRAIVNPCKTHFYF